VSAFETYMRTSYEPEMEFADGRPMERCVGEAIHSFTQGLVAAELGYREGRGYRTFLAPRVYVSDEPRIRVPDVCAMPVPHQAASILRSPHLVVEVLCPGDIAADMFTKIADYHAAAIPHIWLVDPYARRLFDCAGGRIARPEREALSTPLVGEVDFTGMFAEIEKLSTPASESPRP